MKITLKRPEPTPPPPVIFQLELDEREMVIIAACLYGGEPGGKLSRSMPGNVRHAAMLLHENADAWQHVTVYGRPLPDNVKEALRR